jgi:hypothetical protein
VLTVISVLYALLFTGSFILALLMSGFADKRIASRTLARWVDTYFAFFAPSPTRSVRVPSATPHGATGSNRSGRPSLPRVISLTRRRAHRPSVVHSSERPTNRGIRRGVTEWAGTKAVGTTPAPGA